MITTEYIYQGINRIERPIHLRPVYSVAWLSYPTYAGAEVDVLNDDIIISGCGDHCIRTFKFSRRRFTDMEDAVPDMKLVHTEIDAHSDDVNCVQAFNFAGLDSFAVSVSDDQCLKLWALD